MPLFHVACTVPGTLDLPKVYPVLPTVSTTVGMANSAYKFQILFVIQAWLVLVSPVNAMMCFSALSDTAYLTQIATFFN
jgi:hypothetical protein